MAVKASATITLTSYRDTQSVTRYYKLQPAGSSAPLKPETKPPSSDWTDSEPACDISKELYFCDLTIFSNGEWEYSTVSKSTSYEAAKQAYNRADNAQKSIDNLEIGGRNLFLNTGEVISNANYLIAEYTPANEPLAKGEIYTATICVTPAENVSNIDLYFSGGMWRNATFNVDGTSKQVISKTFTMNYDDKHTPAVDISNAYANLIRMPNDGTVTGNTTVHWFKIEKGNKATDWTPAPEDVASKDELVSTNESIRQDVENNYYSHTELGQSLSFNETDGLIIQVPNSPYETRISNTQIEFRYQGQPVAYINGEILVIPKSMMLDEMMVGNNKWSWRIRDNGNLQLKWIG